MTFRDPLQSVAEVDTGQSGQARIVVAGGGRIPANLLAFNGIVSAVVFYAENGSYWALAQAGEGLSANMLMLAAPDTLVATPVTTFYNGQLTGPIQALEVDTVFLGGARLLPIVTTSPISLTAGWSNLGGPWSLCTYTVDASGWVKLQGTLSDPAGAGASPIATGLPHPADGLSHLFDVLINGTAVGRLYVDSVGALRVNTGSFGAGSATSLDGIEYQS